MCVLKVPIGNFKHPQVILRVFSFKNNLLNIEKFSFMLYNMEVDFVEKQRNFNDFGVGFS